MLGRLVRALGAVGMALLCASPLLAQTNRGGISGTIKDATGAGVPGATVTITAIGTNRAVQLVSSTSGGYSAPSLEPLEYRVTVEMPGFNKAVVDHVKVDAGTTTPVNVTIAAGGVETELTVTAEAPIVTGTGTHTITAREIRDLPLVNRSVLDLAVTLPNVSGDPGSEDPTVSATATVPGFNLSLNGGRPGSTIILADGVNNTGVGLARAIVSFSPETVQEFTVHAAYSAEFGQTGGGVINATTKSGTNAFSGRALWYTRRPETNAAPFSTATVNRPVNNLKTDQASFTLGGPVIIPGYDGRDKTFFFLAVEPRWRKDLLQVTTLLPTDAMRSGDFSGLSRLSNGWAPTDVVQRFRLNTTGDATIYQQYRLVGNQLQLIPLVAGQTYAPYPGNRIPANMMDPTAVKALQYMPRAGEYFIDGGGLLANAVIDRFVEQNEVRYNAKLDHALSGHDQISLRYTRVPAVGNKGFASDVNGNGADYSTSQQALLTYTHTFSASLMNETHLNYTRGTFSNDYTPEFNIKTGRNLATELGLPSLTTGGMPLLQFLDGPNAFVNIGSAGSTNNYNTEQRFNFTTVAYWNRGAMSWKFGVEASHEMLNVIPFFGAAGGRYDFRVVNTSSNGTTATGAGGNSYASYLLGVPNAGLLRPVLMDYNYVWDNGAAFIQNDWKVRSNLTLNLGLRYSLQLPRTEKNDLQGVFLPEEAREYTLATPVTLPSGEVIRTALVPPFAYSGRGGRSRYIFPVEYTNFEPRLGFTWSPHHSEKFAIHGGYGLSHMPLTGNNRLPAPDFGATTTIGVGSGQTDPNYVMRLSSNPPLLPTVTPEQVLNIPADGLVYLGSINVPGYAVSAEAGIPYMQNWDLTLSYKLGKNTSVEMAYVGSKGTRMFLPFENLNTRPFDYIQSLYGANLDPNTTVADPLGRLDVIGRVNQVPRGTLDSTYLGFSRLNGYFDASGSSHRHAGFVNLTHRVSPGLLFNANYTYGKSTDDASDASPDKGVLSSPGTAGSVTFGLPLSNDVAISNYDIKHVINATAVYDLPFGKDRHWMSDGWSPWRVLFGDWTASGKFQLRSGYPFQPTLSDTNGLATDATHTVRPDLVPGVPILNPLWSRSCPIGSLCEPYINPAAFMRPLKGTFGNAPRTLDVRGPMQRYLDIAVYKNIPLGGKKRLQLRVDLLNAFNHQIFPLLPGSSNGGDLMGAPSEAVLTATEYDAWATFNSRPPSSTAAGQAAFQQAQQIVTGSRLPSGALPLDFYHVQLPQGFASSDARSYDITTAAGYKLYRSRQAFNSAQFGQLYAPGVSRYVQFGIVLDF